MSAQLLDAFTGQPDPGLISAAELEIKIDAAFARMRLKQASGEESQDEFTELARLVGQRCQTQVLKLELERRARTR